MEILEVAFCTLSGKPEFTILCNINVHLSFLPGPKDTNTNLHFQPFGFPWQGSLTCSVSDMVLSVMAPWQWEKSFTNPLSFKCCKSFSKCCNNISQQTQWLESWGVALVWTTRHGLDNYTSQKIMPFIFRTVEYDTKLLLLEKQSVSKFPPVLLDLGPDFPQCTYGYWCMFPQRWNL